MAGNSPRLCAPTRRCRVTSDQYFCCLRMYLIIRIGMSGREVGGGDHPTPVLQETRVTALRARAVGSLSGVPEYSGRTGLSGELDSGKSAEIESGARPTTPVLLLQQSQGERSRARCLEGEGMAKQRGGNGAAEPRRAMPASAGARRLAPRFYEPGPRITTPDGLPWVRLTRERIPTL